jgi:Leucine-rich repeat (LRR) protein
MSSVLFYVSLAIAVVQVTAPVSASPSSSPTTFMCNSELFPQVGDGRCDLTYFNLDGPESPLVRLNSADCGWDGGDCCAQTCADGEFQCGSNGFACLDPLFTTCGADPSIVGDGRCDYSGSSSANTAACMYDLGDCCPQSCVSGAYSCDDQYVCADVKYKSVFDPLCDMASSLSNLTPEWSCNSNKVPLSPVCGWAGLGCLPPLYRVSEVKLEAYRYPAPLTGTLPSSFGNLTDVTSITISNSMISGPIPASLMKMTQVTFVYMATNPFTGTLPSDCFMPSLGVFSLIESSLSGTIPTCFASSPFLNDLQIRTAKLTGTIPSELAIPSMTILDFSINKLTGTIPTAFLGIPSLNILTLNDNKLSGPIPSLWGANSPMQYLSLQRNRLTGVVPSSLGLVPRLTQLVLSDNLLAEQPLPTFFCNYFELARNKFTGTIPDYVSAVTYYQLGMDFSGNELTGTIPAALGNLTGLMRLSVGSNQLVGIIPNSIATATDLRFLNVSFNCLTGGIPEALSIRSFVIVVYSPQFIQTDAPTAFPTEEPTFEPTYSFACTPDLFPQIGDGKCDTDYFFYEEGNAYIRMNSEFCGWDGGDCCLQSCVSSQLFHCDADANYYELCLDPEFTGCRTSNVDLVRDGTCNYDTFLVNTDNCRYDGGDCCPLPGGKYKGSFICLDPQFKPAYDPMCDFAAATNLGGTEKYSHWDCGESKVPISPICNWEGVSCTDGFVTSLDIGGSFCRGSLCADLCPECAGTLPNSLGQLSGLESLRITQTSLHGRIPNSVLTLRNLTTLDLTKNFFSSSLATQLHLPSLQQWRMGNNLFTGRIPTRIGSSSFLEQIVLSDNLFSGTIPASLGRVTNLAELTLSSNSFSGTLPTFLRATMRLDHNQFEGRIPAYGRSAAANVVDFSFNALTGSIPPSLSSIVGLSVLKLQNNQLVGTLPSAFGLSANLNTIDVSFNYLAGDIPSSLQDKDIQVIFNPQQTRSPTLAPSRVEAKSPNPTCKIRLLN